MKKEILMLIIGILIGAIIATGVFLVLQSNSSSENAGGDMSQMSGEAPDMENGGERGEIPSDSNTTNDTTDDSTTDSNES